MAYLKDAPVLGGFEVSYINHCPLERCAYYRLCLLLLILIQTIKVNVYTEHLKNIRQQVNFCICFILWIVYCSLAQGQINTSLGWLYCKNLYSLKIIISNFSFCFYSNISFWWHEEICTYFSLKYVPVSGLSEIYTPMKRPTCLLKICPYEKAGWYFTERTVSLNNFLSCFLVIGREYNYTIVIHTCP